MRQRISLNISVLPPVMSPGKPPPALPVPGRTCLGCSSSPSPLPAYPASHNRSYLIHSHARTGICSIDTFQALPLCQALIQVWACSGEQERRDSCPRGASILMGVWGGYFGGRCWGVPGAEGGGASPVKSQGQGVSERATSSLEVLKRQSLRGFW